MAKAKEVFDGDLPGNGELRVVLAERRGQWTFALLADANNVAHCLQNDNTTVDTSRGQSSGSEVAPRPTAKGVTTITMLNGRLSTAYGRAGAEVAKVVVDGPDGPVTATVKGGYWAAWWPGQDPEFYERIGWDKYSITVTLRDGTQLSPIPPWPAPKH
jgi:hypothetical protein